MDVREVAPYELAFSKGDHAVLTDLKATHLNGHVVLIIQFMQDKKRFQVIDLSGEDRNKILLVRPKNLKEAFYIDEPSMWKELYSDWDALMFDAVTTTTTIDDLQKIYSKFDTHFGDSRSDTRTKFSMMVNWATAANVKAADVLDKQIRELLHRVINECPFGGFVIDAKTVLIGLDIRKTGHDDERFEKMLLPHLKEHYGRYYTVARFLQNMAHRDITDEMYATIKYHEDNGLYFGARTMDPDDYAPMDNWSYCSNMFISDKYLGDGKILSGTPEDTALGIGMLNLFLQKDYKDKRHLFAGIFLLCKALLAFTENKYQRVLSLLEKYERQRGKIKELRGLREQILLVKGYTLWHMGNIAAAKQCVIQIDALRSKSVYLKDLPRLKERLKAHETSV